MPRTRTPPARGAAKRPRDQDLQAYVDGELDQARREELRAAMRADAQVRSAVARYESQKRSVKRLYDDVLHEPVPDRLRQLLGHGAARSPKPRRDRH